MALAREQHKVAMQIACIQSRNGQSISVASQRYGVNV